MNFKHLGGVVASIAALAACGGGGEDGNPPILTTTAPQTLVLQASAGDLTRYASKAFNSDCGVGFIGAKPFSGYASFSFGTATASLVAGVYNFTPSGNFFSCDGSSTALPQAINFDMTYAGTTTVASYNSSATGVADVFIFKDKTTGFVNTQTFAFDNTYNKLYTSNATASFSSSSLPHNHP